MRLKEASNLFAALSDETRLRIVNLLAGGELCVCDLTRVLKLSQPKISRHLAHLRRSKLVTTRRRGVWMHYRLTEAAVRLFGASLASLGLDRTSFPELRKDLEEFKRKQDCLVGCC